MSDDFGDNHPARKVDLDELMRLLADRNQDVPAITTRVLAQEYPEVDPQTIRNNLDDLADDDKICRFNDGDTKLFWYPRPNEDGGTIKYGELIDDSVDWEDVDLTDVPEDVAEAIASERLPFYRPRSFWTQTAHASQLGVMVSFGLVILGIGGLVGGPLGLGQQTGARLFRWGLYLSVASMLGYVISMFLENMAARGRIAKDPLSAIDWLP